jgi:hypothetical protein
MGATMKTIAAFSQFLSRSLTRVRLAARFKLAATLAPDLIEVRVPHPHLDLDDFWAFGRTAD